LIRDGLNVISGFGNRSGDRLDIGITVDGDRTTGQMDLDARHSV
jgi:hypothetical protein